MQENLDQTRNVQGSKLVIRVVGITLILFCGLLGVNNAEVIDRIVAVVNSDVILLTELNEALKPFGERIRNLGYPLEQQRKMLYQAREEVLNQLIEAKLTDEEIKRYDISVSQKEIEGTIESIKRAHLYTDEDLRKALATQGLTMETYRERMREQILRRRLVNREIKSKIVITTEDIRAYYESHMDQYAGQKRYHLRNIIMQFSSYRTTENRQAVYQRMQQVYAKLKSGEDFESLARAYSEAPFAAEGGDLGFFELSELAPQIQEAVAELGPGQFTDIIETGQGYQIFFLEEIEATPTKTLAEATPEIQQTLFDEVVDQRFQSWLKELREQSHIRVIN